MNVIFINPTNGKLILNDKYGNLIVKLSPNATFDITSFIGEVNSLDEILEKVTINNHIESLLKNKIRGKKYIKVNQSEYFLLQENIKEKIKITFTDVNLITDATSLEYWNTFFSTDTMADKPFNKVEVVGNSVYLYGPSSLSANTQIFKDDSNLISIEDDSIFTEIKNGCFSGCYNLTKVSIPKVIEIETYAFDGNTDLEDVFFPEVEIVGDYSFSNSSSLVNASFPKLKTIGLSAFYTSALMNGEFPIVETVGDSAFAECGSLIEISLPRATSIGDSAFSMCVSLENIYLPIVTSIGENVFDDTFGNTITLTIPHDILASENSSIMTLTGQNTVTIIET